MNDSELRARYRERHTRVAADRAQCLTSDELVSASRASGRDAPSHDRARIVDHLITCTNCADELKMIRSLSEWSDALDVKLDVDEADDDSPNGVRRPAPRWGFGLAAVFALAALGLGVWASGLARETERLSQALAEERGADEQLAAARAALAESERTRTELAGRVARYSEPHMNLALIDLEPDGARARGADNRVATVTVPRADAFFSLILHASGPVRTETETLRVRLMNTAGERLFTRDGVARSEFGTLTLALSPSSLPEDTYILQVFDGEAARESYTFHLAYR